MDEGMWSMFLPFKLLSVELTLFDLLFETEELVLFVSLLYLI